MRFTQIRPDGFVKLVAHMCDEEFIVEAARIGRPSETDWRRTLRYMMRNRHTSPFEFVTFVFHVRLPIFVARQWMRHRAGTFNEWSARYMELPYSFWSPTQWRGQAATNRQSSEGEVKYTPLGFVEAIPPDYDLDPEVVHTAMKAETAAFQEYKRRIEEGIAREQARSCLPLSTNTEFYWKVDLHNLLHFLDLRTDSHAQQEIRDYAVAIEEMLDTAVPETMRAWRDFRKETVTLTANDIKRLKGLECDWESPSEARESDERLRKLGLNKT